MQGKRLVRSRSDRMLGGVCGGLGEYLGIDPMLVRLFFVLLTFGEGIGVMLYLLLWLLIPVEGSERPGRMEETIQEGAEEIAERARTMSKEIREGVSARDERVAWILGGGLVVIGSLLLLERLNLSWLAWFRLNLLWPLLLIVAGVALLLRQARGG